MRSITVQLLCFPIVFIIIAPKLLMSTQTTYVGSGRRRLEDYDHKYKAVRVPERKASGKSYGMDDGSSHQICLTRRTLHPQKVPRGDSVQSSGKLDDGTISLMNNHLRVLRKKTWQNLAEYADIVSQQYWVKRNFEAAVSNRHPWLFEEQALLEATHRDRLVLKQQYKDSDERSKQMAYVVKMMLLKHSAVSKAQQKGQDSHNLRKKHSP